MASAARCLLPSPSLPRRSLPEPRTSSPPCHFRFRPPFPTSTDLDLQRAAASDLRARYRSWRGHGDRHFEESPEDEGRFERAVSLFNSGDFYSCHDVLEDMWHGAEEPVRTLLHGILQCAVGLHHLFNRNHRGAMMELGEGLCKLRKMNFESGPFHRFEQEVAVALEFLYQTQKELAACTNDLCLAMDGSERSYQLLGSFAAGESLYNLETGPDGASYVLFCPDKNYNMDKPVRVKLPVLCATEEHLSACSYLSN